MENEYEWDSEKIYTLKCGDLVKVSIPPDTTSKEAVVIKFEKESLTVQPGMWLIHGAPVVIETSSLLFLGSVTNVETNEVIIQLEHVLVRKLAEELRRKVIECAE